MTTWDTYPIDYRAKEVQSILAAVQAGDCVSLVGLSGSGKSNLLGFIANRLAQQQPPLPGLPTFVLVDCNRAVEFTLPAFFRLLLVAMQVEVSPLSTDEFSRLEGTIRKQLASGTRLCLLLDRFDAFTHPALDEKIRLALASNLRALRDAYKYDLTLVIATRHPPDPHTELAELLFANTLWLGPLCEKDARWNIARYASRRNLAWDEETTQAILRLSWGYPSILRAACEAMALSSSRDESSLTQHPAVCKRVEEFWADGPTQEELRLSRLAHHPLLDTARTPGRFDTSQLTAKEHLMWQYMLRRAGQVCEKDDLIRAVWPEDRIYEQGIRDDSLAQLVRRLREKIEPDPSNPKYILTLPGRGYRLCLEPKG